MMSIGCLYSIRSTENFFFAWQRASSPVYDPTLTRVVYGSGFHDSSNLIHPIVTLWDAQANQKVWEIETTDWGDTPVWTPDGKQFVFAANLDLKQAQLNAREFFSVSRDGEARQLTHFMDYFDEIYILDSYNLSPNGKLLAFWIITQPSLASKPELAVLNIETGEVTNYCITGDAFADNRSEPSSPIWSPDSTQLLVVSRIPEDTKVRRVVMVNLVQNHAAKILADMEPEGWMVAP